MTCDQCVPSVTEEVSAVARVTDVQVDLTSRKIQGQGQGEGQGQGQGGLALGWWGLRKRGVRGSRGAARRAARRRPESIRQTGTTTEVPRSPNADD